MGLGRARCLTLSQAEVKENSPWEVKFQGMAFRSSHKTDVCAIESFSLVGKPKVETSVCKRYTCQKWSSNKWKTSKCIEGTSEHIIERGGVPNHTSSQKLAWLETRAQLICLWARILPVQRRFQVRLSWLESFPRPGKIAWQYLERRKPDPEGVLSSKTPPKLVPKSMYEIREAKAPFSKREADLTPPYPVGLASGSSDSPEELGHEKQPLSASWPGDSVEELH